MELAGELFSPTLRWWLGALYGLALYYALRMAPWRRLRDSEQLHVFLGACVSLILLWSMRIQAVPGLQFHMLGVTSLTLMFGWSLALLAASLALLAVTLNGAAGWDGFVLSTFTLALLPITLTQVLLVVVRSLLPKNFFIYVLVNGFFTGGLAALVSGYAAIGLLLWSGSHDLTGLSETLLPFFPLMFLPEGLLNGWIMTVLAALRPHWLSSFDDDLYIRGK